MQLHLCMLQQFLPTESINNARKTVDGLHKVKTHVYM